MNTKRRKDPLTNDSFTVTLSGRLPERNGARLNLGMRLVAVLVAAACAPAAQPAPSPTGAPQAETLEQRFGRLFEAAKIEGKLALYSSMNTDDASRILPKFEARFPGIKVQHTRAPKDKLVQRIVTERRAGQELFDVLETSIFEVRFIGEQRFTQPYRVISLGDLPPELRDRDDRWVVDRTNFKLIGINTTKVQPGQISAWRDLCQKQYEGRIAVEKDEVAVYSALKRILGEPEAQSVVRCLAANKPTIRSGHNEMLNFLAAGDFAIGVTLFGHQLAQQKSERKAPIDWVRIDPIITDLVAMALSNKPPHPNAAKLFMEWLASPEGQQAVGETGRAPASTKITLKYPELAGSGKFFFITPQLAADFDKDAEFWRSAFGLR